MSAEIAIKPDRNIYSRLTSVKFPTGKRYNKEQIRNAKSNPIENVFVGFGRRGSINTEKNRRADKNDLNAVGKVSSKNKIRAENE